VRALTCAAIDDVTAWCLLALTISVAQARPGAAFATLVLTLGYVALMFVVVRPIVERICREQEVCGQLPSGAVAAGLLALLVSALLTELIGVHALFGAFLMGAMIPSDSLLAREMMRRLEDIVHVLLLPTFFAFTGLRTELGLVSGLGNWTICGLIVLIACLGKIGGSAVAAQLSGMNARDSASLGVLMNTRGLMELIVLNIGLEMRVISPTLFAMMVIMAIVTTLATSPLLHALTRGGTVPGSELSTARALTEEFVRVSRT
jgi:Kef-type K+ transport system membrane component KefB